MNLVDLLHPDGVENPGGIATLHGFARIADMLVIQKTKELTDPDATPVNVAQIDVPHTFKPGKSMIKLYSTQNKGTLKSAVVGDYDGIGKKTSGELFLPGLTAASLGNSRLLENTNGILFVDMSDGQVVQVGSERFPAKCKTDFDATNNEGLRGTKIMFETYERMTIYTPGFNFTPDVAMPLAAVITTQPATQAIAVGANAVLTVAATNYKAINWFKGTVDLGIHVAGLTFFNARTTDSGTYHAEVVGLDNVTVISANAVLTVA